MSAAKRGGKPPKVPRLFPVEIDDRAFSSRILKRVHTAGDRQFLERLYPAAAGGPRRRREDLGEPDLRRLASLAKSIAANRGVVQVPKLVILGVIVAAVLVFNLAFKNALLTRALVAGLEGVFGARAEVAGLDFRVLGGRVAIDAIAVADRQQPMRNLFELGRIELSLDVFRLLEGRVIVRELACRDVRWDTPRAVSGALAPAPVAGGADGVDASPEAAGGGVLDEAKGLLDDLDIPGLVDREIGTLASPRMLRDANATISNGAASWDARVAEDRSDVAELAVQVEGIRTFDYSTVKTLKDAQALVDAIAAAAPRVKSLTKELETAGRDLAAEAKQARAGLAAVSAGLRADAATLQEKLDLSPARWKGLAGRIADRALERYLGMYARYVRRAWDAAANLVGRSRDGAPKKKPLARTGRTVIFPGTALPRFYLVDASFSVTEQTGVPGISATLADVTGDPDLVGRPATLNATATSGPARIELAVMVDARTGAAETARVTAGAEGVGVALRDGLEPAGLASLSGTAALSTDFALGVGGGVSGGGSVDLRGITIVPARAGDPVAGAVAGAIASVPRATAEFTFTATAARSAPVISVRTNLDDILARKIGEQLDRLAVDARAGIEAELRKRLGDDLGASDDLLKRYADLQAAVGGDLARTKGFATVLADAQKELEKRLKSALPLPKLTF